MFKLTARQMKITLQILLIFLGLWGVSITRSFMQGIVSLSIFGIVDVGTVVGIASLVVFYWSWRRLV